MVMKRRPSDVIFDSFNYFILLILLLVTFYPFLYIVVASLSDPLKVLQSGSILLWPRGFNIGSYEMVFRNPMISVGYCNTIMYVVIGTAINIFMTSLGAYVLSRKDLYGKKLLMLLIAFTMFFSGGLIPSYLLINKLNMMNTIWALVVPGAVSTWNLIVMRTSFEGIPDSMCESAKIDGANDFTILLKVILPLSLPILAVMTLFYSVGHWNSWFGALLYLRDRKMYPLQLILREILITNSVESMTTGLSGDIDPVAENIKYATVVIATVPILLVYPFLQKYFVKGVMIGAIKG